MTRLQVAAGDSPDDVYAAVVDWAAEEGLELYPHQDEAVIELLGGANVVLVPVGASDAERLATISFMQLLQEVARLAREQGMKFEFFGVHSHRTNLKEEKDMDEFTERVQNNLALQRGGEPDEVVGAAIYFASAASSFCSGAVLRLDGGGS